jgi:hypothetical protein
VGHNEIIGWIIGTAAAAILTVFGTFFVIYYVVLTF